MKLTKFLSQNKITVIDFAKEVNCSASMLYLINTGRRRPSPELALRIEQQTGGMVSRDEQLFPAIYEHIENLESKIKPEFDRALSRRIDNATIIIEG
jgi:hypothetical protein